MKLRRRSLRKSRRWRGGENGYETAIEDDKEDGYETASAGEDGYVTASEEQCWEKCEQQNETCKDMFIKRHHSSGDKSWHQDYQSCRWTNIVSS